MAKKMSAERYGRLGGIRKFYGSFSRAAIIRKAGKRQIYRLPSGAFITRRPKRKKK